MSGAKLEHFIPFRGTAEGPAGLLLAINPHNVTHISSAYSKEFKQSILRIHLANGRQVSVFESDAGNVLEALGLSEFVEDWVLDLEKEVG